MYEITFCYANGKIVKSVIRSIRGVLNNGVARRIAKEEKIAFYYWISKVKN